ncbi:hypothetical protein K3553_08440 [Leisingera aquaemixtae]|uniref:hypothetical protein n=1 Tax=Leisingera aquaemixtae TaxID=1396826 RepID=UPI0021A51064|nr:hypothetical protein [Leisingera aquaemixtae]UWQ26479.1 hypothetical protein K3553_08440 [Leisingera aquaemixtae]
MAPRSGIHDRDFESGRIPLKNASHIAEILWRDVDMQCSITVEPVPVNAVMPLREPLTAAAVRNRGEWKLCRAATQRPSPGPNIRLGPITTRQSSLPANT